MRFTRRRLITAVAAVGGLLSAGFGVRSAQARYYDGPVSDHFDGLRFFDPNSAPPKGVGDLLRWWASPGKSAWPTRVGNKHADRPPPRVEGARLRIAAVGHATLLLQTAGLNILTDPVWSERASPVRFAGPKRVREPGIPFEALPKIDVVVVTHCHYDHLDVETLSRLAAAHRPRVITPLGNDTIMHAHDPAIRAEAFDWGLRVPLSSDVALTFTPIRHWSARGLLDRNKALWAAAYFETPFGGVFHVGDTGYGGGHHFRAVRERYGAPRLAILPVGAYEPRWFMRDQHMNPEEAVRAFADLGAEFAVGHHFGVFQLTDEAIDAPLRALEAARASAGIAPERFRALEPGEAWELGAGA